MKPRNREITIFNLSMLDVISGALGAFVIIMIVLFPYYNNKTFLVVYITWKTGQDVDLHVVDPSGAEFYYQRKRHPNRPGELSEDNIQGPGAEVWEIRDAPSGTYRVYLKLYDAKRINRAPEVRGRVFYRDGNSQLPETRLTRVGDKKLVATITVEPDGSVEFHADAS